jgi:ABC-type Fe3+-hydroxamate transport system substrate-binding protein
LDTLTPYLAFAARTADTKRQLLSFITQAQAEGKVVAALGASTKGNVLLQYCGVTESEIAYVGEVNVEKYGCFTPGTWIPIVSESDILKNEPDYLIVLPWHFRKFFISKCKWKHAKLVFPLPMLEII